MTCCGSRYAGRSVWLRAGEEDAEFDSERNLSNNVFSSLALSRLILLLLEACDLFHLTTRVVLLKLVRQLLPVHVLGVSNLAFTFFSIQKFI